MAFLLFELCIPDRKSGHNRITFSRMDAMETKDSDENEILEALRSSPSVSLFPELKKSNANI